MSGSSRSTPWMGHVPGSGIEEGDDATCEGCCESSATKYDDDGYRLCDECYAAAIEEESK